MIRAPTAVRQGSDSAAFTLKVFVTSLHATFAPQSVLSCARMNALLRILLAALLILAAGRLAQAHPHVWVTMQTELIYAPDGSITGIRHAWSFDDMFSTFATQGLESKEKGKFTREELAPLAKVNVESLKEFGYFKTPVKAKELKIEIYDPSIFVDFAFAKDKPAQLAGAPKCKLDVVLPREMTFAEGKALSQIPADQKNTTMAWGAQFASKILVHCP